MLWWWQELLRASFYCPMSVEPMADPAWVATEQPLLHQTGPGSALGCNRVGSSPGGVSCLPLLPFLNAWSGHGRHRSAEPAGSAGVRPKTAAVSPQSPGVCTGCGKGRHVCLPRAWAHRAAAATRSCAQQGCGRLSTPAVLRACDEAACSSAALDSGSTADRSPA